jgi:hypothetical protein
MENLFQYGLLKMCAVHDQACETNAGTLYCDEARFDDKWVWPDCCGMNTGIEYPDCAPVTAIIGVPDCSLDKLLFVCKLPPCCLLVSPFKQFP